MNNIQKNIIALAFFVVAFLAPASFLQVSHAEAFSVTTNGISSMGLNSVMLNGYVTNPDGRSSVYFVWGGGDTTGENTTSQREYNGNANFQNVIIGIVPGETYFFRAVANSTSSNQKVYGSTVWFTAGKNQFVTQPTRIIETKSATNVTSTSAALTGAVNPQSGSDAMRWFEWGKTQSLGSATPREYQSTFTGDYSHAISNLTPDTNYYFRAMALIDNSSVIGQTNTFKTLSTNSVSGVSGNSNTKSIAITLPPKVFSGDHSVLAASIISQNAVSSRAWFEWGTTNSLGTKTSVRNTKSATTVNFSDEISTLSPKTTYFYKVVIENEYGTTEGSILSFTTTGTKSSQTPGTQNSNTDTKDDEGATDENESIEGDIQTGDKSVATTTVKSETKNKKNNNTASTAGFLGEGIQGSVIGWLVLILLIILIVIALDHLIDRIKKRNESAKRISELNTDEERVIK